MVRVRAPFPWYGGKQYMAPTLASLLPPHDCYVEVFGGAAALLWAKTPSAVEIYNDLDSGLVNFFRVLREPKRSRELRRLLDLTPYAREEWQECRHTWQDAPSDVEMARRWFVALNGSFSKSLNEGGWSFSKTPNHDKAHSFRTMCDTLPLFTARMRHVQVEHGDFARVMATFDGKATLFYLDPPYLPETRCSHGYRHEMTLEDHARLLNAARAVAGMVMISGYRSDLYDAALADWRRVERPVFNCSTKQVREKRVECIWLSPNATRHQPTLPFTETQEAV